MSSPVTPHPISIPMILNHGNVCQVLSAHQPSNAPTIGERNIRHVVSAISPSNKRTVDCGGVFVPDFLSGSPDVDITFMVPYYLEICYMPRRNNTPGSIRKPHAQPCAHKRRFRNEQETKNAIDDATLRDPSLQLSIYRCDYCGGWHLTSIKRDTPSK